MTPTPDYVTSFAHFAESVSSATTADPTLALFLVASIIWGAALYMVRNSKKVKLK